MKAHETVSREEWIEARKELLELEKDLTRRRDRLNRCRLALPRVKVEESYLFDGPDGKETLADLFGGRSQLLVYHFMLGPGWEEGCPSCSLIADHFDGSIPHLARRDVTLLAVSRAPWAQIEPFKRRMGWKFKWVSSHENDFNFDYHVSFTKEDAAKGKIYYNYREEDFHVEELPGISAFSKDESGDIFHTYSSYARGCDILIGAYNFLDIAPKGRDEDNLAFSMSWVRHHDRYADDDLVDASALYSPPKGANS